VTNDVAFLSRQGRFRSIPSTNDIVRTWLTEGTAEVCLAVADEQTAGRGRSGRSWVAPDGAALLLSLGFRPSYLEPDRLWRLPAIVALAMADAAEEVAGLPMGMLKLKWPNDIVVDAPAAPAGVHKVAGLLGETEGAATAGVSAVVGIGINADWPRESFPADLAGTRPSLRAASRGRPIDAGELLDGFISRLEARLLGLRRGNFDVAGWHDRQITTGRAIRVEMPDGTALATRAVGVDGISGALMCEDPDGAERELLIGEVVQVRIVRDADATAGGTTDLAGGTTDVAGGTTDLAGGAASRGVTP
jgi:BirA family biotin operon repressor/biotin-[acetyl-CoA-carboxylase] ligase